MNWVGARTSARRLWRASWLCVALFPVSCANHASDDAEQNTSYQHHDSQSASLADAGEREASQEEGTSDRASTSTSDSARGATGDGGASVPPPDAATPAELHDGSTGDAAVAARNSAVGVAQSSIAPGTCGVVRRAELGPGDSFLQVWQLGDGYAAATFRGPSFTGSWHTLSSDWQTLSEQSAPLELAQTSPAWLNGDRLIDATPIAAGQTLLLWTSQRGSPYGLAARTASKQSVGAAHAIGTFNPTDRLDVAPSLDGQRALFVRTNVPAQPGEISPEAILMDPNGTRIASVPMASATDSKEFSTCAYAVPTPRAGAATVLDSPSHTVQVLELSPDGSVRQTVRIPIELGFGCPVIGATDAGLIALTQGEALVRAYKLESGASTELFTPIPRGEIGGRPLWFGRPSKDTLLMLIQGSAGPFMARVTRDGKLTRIPAMLPNVDVVASSQGRLVVRERKFDGSGNPSGHSLLEIACNLDG